MIYCNYLLIVDPAMHVVYFRSSRQNKEGKIKARVCRGRPLVVYRGTHVNPFNVGIKRVGFLEAAMFYGHLLLYCFRKRCKSYNKL